MYIFINGNSIEDDTDTHNLDREKKIELFTTQSKMEGTLEKTPAKKERFFVEIGRYFD